VAGILAAGGTSDIPAHLERLVHNVLDLEAALELNITLGLADMSAVEFKALVALRQARQAESERRQQREDAMAAARQKAAQTPGGF
jgi:hypothetical protein